MQKEGLTLFKKFFGQLTNKKAFYILVIVGIVTFCFSLFNGFVADDISQIVTNPKVQSISNIISFFRGGTYLGNEGLNGLYYKPLLLAFFSLSINIFGLNAFPLHLFQLILHITNAVLVFYLFKHFISRKISLFLSLLFLIHPINSESVFYISGLQEPLFFFFGISSLLLILYKNHTSRNLIRASLLVLLSLLSKEGGSLFFLAIVLSILFFQNKNRIKDMLFFIPSIILYLLLRLSAPGIVTNHVIFSPISSLSLTQRIMNIPSLFYFYLTKFLYPKDLVFSYNNIITKIDLTNFYFPLFVDVIFVLVIISCGLYIFLKNRKHIFAYIFFCLWFAYGISLYMQVIPLDMSASERWFYFPIIGVLGMFGLFIQSLHVKSVDIKNILIVFLSIMLFSLGFRSVIRGLDWQNPITLYTHDLQLNKNDYLIHSDLGYELYRSGNLNEAKAEFEKSYKLFPESIISYDSYCLIDAIIGQKQGNKELLVKAIQCYEGMVTHFNSGAIYDRLVTLSLLNNDIKAARKYRTEGLIKFPNDPGLLNINP
jgi:tetratricopeptide (TPR) repeat protein